MLAQAIRKLGGSSTNVTAESVAFNMDGYRFTYPLPAAAAHELIKFDKNKKLTAPFKFVLHSNTGFIKPVVPRGKVKRKENEEPRRYTTPKVKRSWRRYHGLRTLEVFNQEEK